MSDEEVLQGPIEKLRGGDLDGALEELDALMGSNKTNAQVHHMYAEFANMKNAEAQDDVIPGGKIMMAYKKSHAIGRRKYGIHRRLRYIRTRMP